MSMETSTMRDGVIPIGLRGLTDNEDVSNWHILVSSTGRYLKPSFQEGEVSFN